jgi:four helix bundle protein
VPCNFQIVLTMRNDKENVIVNMTFRFAIEVVQVAEELESKRKFVLGNQLLRSGTSIGAMVREAQNAESKADFIHKLKIAAKECDETVYWLELCKEAYSLERCTVLINKANEIMLVLSKIIATTKKSLRV